LLDLFDGRHQLIVYRAFFEPGVVGWPEHACVGCSMVADQVAHPAHLNARDTTLAFASRAPQTDIERLKARMGWQFIPWYTMTDGFDKDFGVDEWHGTNAFIRDGDRVFRTYFINNRGDEQMGNTWNYRDITARGRQEEWEDSPEGYPQTPPDEWWIWHDEPNPESDRPGSRFRLWFCRRAQGQHLRPPLSNHEGHPQKKIAYTWRYERHEGDPLVPFELFPEREKNRLRLPHEGLETFPKTAAFPRQNF